MSTAMVSPLSDVTDTFMQNQNHLMNTRGGQLNLQQMLSMLTPEKGSSLWGGSTALASLNPTQTQSSAGRTRNSSGSSSSSSGSQRGKYTPTSPQHMISSFPGDNIALQQQQANIRAELSAVPHRKLDRSISEPVGSADRNNNNSKNVNSSRYKTELCRPFEENGFCKYGDKCQFAHGENELRNLNRHPKYKTELCRTFHSVGFCPYGPRCHFIHNEDERKLSQISHLKQQQAHQQANLQQQQQLQVVQQLLAQAQQQVPRSAPQNVAVTRSSAAKALNFSHNLPPLLRDSLGSTADSPPSSLRGSPTLSPMSMLSDDLMQSSASSTLSSMFSSTPPPQSAPPGFTSAFTFPQPLTPQQQPETPSLSGLVVPPVNPPTPPVMAPLNVQTTDPIASLAAEMSAASLQASLQQQNTSPEVLQDMFFMPPSPPHSIEEESTTMSPNPTTSAPSCGSPMDLSRNLRLPIFSQLSINDN